MAPILATSTGVTPQVLDDPDLIQLLSSLKVLALVDSEVSLKELADLLEPWKSEWLFEEQVRSFRRQCFACLRTLVHACFLGIFKSTVACLFEKMGSFVASWKSCLPY